MRRINLTSCLSYLLINTYDVFPVKPSGNGVQHIDYASVGRMNYKLVKILSRTR